MPISLLFFRKKLFDYGIIPILFFALIIRLIGLDLPHSYIFDEVYHVVTAKLIARNDPRAFEWWNPPIEPNTAVDWLHPPLAKYTQAAGMLVFGENSFGWRISSALFGVLVVALVYLLSEELFQKRWLSLLAAGLASLDGLLLVMSRVAMNDIHVTAFILLTILLYIRYRKHRTMLWLIGLSAGLAISSKWSGVFILGWVWIAELQRLIAFLLLTGKKLRPAVLLLALTTIRYVCYLVVLPAVVYVLSYSMMFAQGKDTAHFFELHRQIIWYQTHLEATHSYQSRPHEWFLNWRPVWFHVQYSEKSIANIYAQGNPLLMWAGVVAASISLLALLRRWLLQPQELLHFSPLLIALSAYLVVWVPWLASPRIMFYYHYTPAVPLLSILVAYWLVKLWEKKQRALVVVILSAITVAFALWLPNWMSWPVPISFAERLYFVLPNWR